ncbi:unnamed protein product [Allacma fusca]|uniref:Uncharacterized protein n=1 Tax=Allacma fusca TaxID=39272 RepID=A0A8J2KQY6_9HEXA|nr:unnamed protein product [Allacma fusca]
MKEKKQTRDELAQNVLNNPLNDGVRQICLSLPVLYILLSFFPRSNFELRVADEEAILKLVNPILITFVGTGSGKNTKIRAVIHGSCELWQFDNVLDLLVHLDGRKRCELQKGV